jgi:hypothetical protein
LIGSLFASAAAGSLFCPAPWAGAEGPKLRQKWQYATLYYHGSRDEPKYDSVKWTAGKTVLEASSEKAPLECISRLNKDLGGKEETASIAVLLDRIGQDGWEMLTHTSSHGAYDVHHWEFKRPIP